MRLLEKACHVDVIGSKGGFLELRSGLFFFFIIIGAVGVVTGEDTMCTDHSRQQNDRSNSGSNTERSTPLTNGYKYHISLRENCRYENSERYEDDDELDEDKNQGYCRRNKAADGNGTYASARCSFFEGNGNGDDDATMKMKARMEIMS